MIENHDDDNFPDIRDGLTRKQRIVMDCLNKIQVEMGDRNIPTSMLYGRVLEHINISVDEMQSILQRFSGSR